MTEPSVPAVPIMAKAKARKLIDRIKTKADDLWADILEAHDGGAWKALGYKSWGECAEVEFGKSRSRSYQLLDHARLMGELKAAPNVSTRVDSLTPKDSTRMGAEGRAKLAADHAAATTPEEADAAFDKAQARLDAKWQATMTGPTAEPGTSNPAAEPEPTGSGIVVRDIRLPIALNHRAEERADDAGVTVNEYVVALIEADLGPLPAANGQKARPPIRAPAMEAAMARRGSTATVPRQSNVAADGHKHIATKAKQGASGMVRCDVCGIPKVGTRWVEQ